jgi:regulator of sigma D
MTENTNDRRENTGKLIQELLEERQQVWSLYCKIAAMQPFAADPGVDAKLQEFCQLLIDYISLGHFGIYQRITDGSERRKKVLEVAEQIYPRIVEATDAAVEFNDKYESLSGEDLREQLVNDLSRLGEELATRIDLEDQLLSAMAGCHPALNS